MRLHLHLHQWRAGRHGHPFSSSLTLPSFHDRHHSENPTGGAAKSALQRNTASGARGTDCSAAARAPLPLRRAGTAGDRQHAPAAVHFHAVTGKAQCRRECRGPPNARRHGSGNKPASGRRCPLSVAAHLLTATRRATPPAVQTRHCYFVNLVKSLEPEASKILFTSTCRSCEELSVMLDKLEVPNVSLHSQVARGARVA